MKNDSGVALILAILLAGFLSAIGLGLGLMVVTDQLATTNLRASTALLYIADAALELSIRDLSRIDDWSLALMGEARGRVTVGDPAVERGIPGGGVLNLALATNHLNCNRSTPCTDAQMNTSTRERPWGANNARWRLFAYGPVGNFVELPEPPWSHVAVWLADDGREDDGDPERDASEGAPGHGVVRARVEAYGSFGMKRAIEAELARLCVDDEEPCRQGIRVQSWHEVRQAVP